MSGRQLLRYGTHISLRDQTLQFRKTRPAIGAGLQPRTDLGGGICAGRDRVADRGAPDAKTGANDGASTRQAVRRFARQQHPPFVISELICCKQILDHFPVAGIVGGANEQTGFDAPLRERGRAINAAAEIAVFGQILAGEGLQP